MTDNAFQGNTVVVTGAAGFIGSHLCDGLISGGAHVIAVDNFITGRRQNIQHLSDNLQFEFIEADVSTTPEKYLPPAISIDFVFHCASPASPPKYQAKPVETYLVNSLGTHLLLDYLRQKQPLAVFVFASTSEVYGDPQVHPQPESYWGNVNPNGVRSCYDEAKRLGETVCGVHAREFGVDARIARIFNTYGSRINPDDGRIIPNFIKQALNHESLTIYGDGSQTRSYCYVSDLVEGLLLLATVSAAKNETINLGNPEEFTVQQTAEIINDLINNSNRELTKLDLPVDDPTRRQPDITKAQQILSWQPQIDFRTGLQKTITYFAQSEIPTEGGQ